MVSGGARSAPESNHRDDLRGSTPLALLAPLTMTEKSARRRGDYDGVFERAEHYWNPFEEDRLVAVSGGKVVAVLRLRNAKRSARSLVEPRRLPHRRA